LPLGISKYQSHKFKVSNLHYVYLFFQAIPRTLWLDPNGKQLVQWPVEELNNLRGEEVKMNRQKLQKGDYVEVKGITAAQVRFLCNQCII